MNSTLPFRLHPVPLGLEPSFGFGDRLGLATPGHLAALRQSGGSIKGIFSQQSIREMTRTKRTAEQVMSAAEEALRNAGFEGAWGADADHLKTRADIQVTADAGFVFYTIDPSEFVDQHADDYDEQTLNQKYEAIRNQVDWLDDYAGKTISVGGGPTIRFEQQAVLRAAVKYGLAIQHTVQMAQWIKDEAERRRQPFEIEVSVDETEQPTSLGEHYIIADRLRRQDVRIVSLAPRFIGELEKGVDYKGDLEKLEASLQDHAAIARTLGPYKLSLHSGSDKLSMYALLSRSTAGLYHVKTAGTSYLEALRVLAHREPELFREIVVFSRGRYDVDKATYHVSATLDTVPPPEELKSPADLERIYLERWEDVPMGRGFTEPGRQILHCTFGSVLTHEKYGPLVHQSLRENADLYEQVLCEHFSRHLQALNAGAT